MTTDRQVTLKVCGGCNGGGIGRGGAGHCSTCGGIGSVAHPKALQPMGEGKWSAIVHAANGAPRYGHVACMGCGREQARNAFVGIDGNWYCGTPENSPCEGFAWTVREHLGLQMEALR